MGTMKALVRSTVLHVLLPLMAGTIGARQLKLPHEIAGPGCLIGTSNFFELAVAIPLLGLHAEAALVTVVGVPVDVPVMLSLCWLVNRSATARAAAPA